MTRLQELKAEVLAIENEKPVRPDLWNCTEEEARTYQDTRNAWCDKSAAAFKALHKELTV